MQEQDLEKEVYIKPSIEIINIEYEGILCASGNYKVHGQSDRWGGSWGDEF